MAKKAKATKRKANPAFLAQNKKTYKPSAALAAVIGEKPLPRPQVTKKIWEYIKKNKLQDGRIIIADEKLKVVFGGKAKVDMFQMTALYNKHLKSAE